VTADPPSISGDLKPDRVRRTPGDAQGTAALWSRLFAPRSPSSGPAPVRPFSQLRRRMILTNVAVAAAVLALLSTALYIYDAEAAWQQVDHVVASEALHEAASAQPAPPSGTETPEAPYQPSSPNLFSVILAAPHEVIQDDDSVQQYGLPDWRSAAAVLSGRAPGAFATVQRGGNSFRLYTAPIRDHGRVVGAVQSGMSLVQLNGQLHGLRLVLVLLGLGVLLLTVVSSLVLTERALAPARAAYVRQRQFAAGASHELRTPLAFIRSQAELIVSQLRDRAATPSGTSASGSGGPQAEPVAPAEADQVIADAQEIIGEVDYMARLVRDLLVLARDEQDRQSQSWTVVDLSPLVGEAAARVRAAAEDHGVALRVDVPRGDERPTSVPVRGDPDRLRQLLLILLDNAIKYTSAGGAVSVRVEAVHRPVRLPPGPGGQALITVSDTGVGIAPEHVPHLFEPFYRATGAPGQPRAEGSTGLGLALADWIVRAHDGTISVHSVPGSGSTFTVRLPLA
jgi:signal transduction histidine kinase